MTQAFANLAGTAARARGHAGLPIVVLPHPLEGRGRDELEEIARRRFDEVVGHLVARRDP